eukprot:5043438-Pyramimonas_sp.AAC.1
MMGATVTFTRGAEVPIMAFWHDSGSSRSNNQVDPSRWNPENNALASSRVFKRLPSNEAIYSVEQNRCRPCEEGALREATNGQPQNPGNTLIA